MHEQHHLRLTDLEFVEEFSERELGAVTGGQAPPTPQTGISSVDSFLSNLRTERERDFQQQFPELTPIVFPLSGGN